MTSTSSLESQVQNLLQDLKKRKEMVLVECENRIKEIDKEIESVSITSRILRRGTPAVSPSQAQAYISLDKIEGKTHVAAMVEIAKSNHGVLLPKEAKRLMVQAGLFKTPQNAAGAIYSALSRSEIFRKVEKGRYRLIEEGDSHVLPLSEHPSDSLRED